MHKTLTLCYNRSDCLTKISHIEQFDSLKKVSDETQWYYEK